MTHLFQIATIQCVHIPRTQMTPIFEGQPPKTRPFPIKTGVIWVPGMHIHLHQTVLVGWGWEGCFWFFNFQSEISV